MDGKVYILNLNKINIEYTHLLNELPVYCLNKIDKGSNEGLKKVRVLTWYILYKILLEEYNIDLTKIDIFENEHGKPYINDLYFNVTHSKEYIGIIISKEECGIDIEKIELNVDKDRFAKKILTENEYKEYTEHNSLDYLIKKWTIIETYYKILGKGIAFSKLNLEIDFANIFTHKLADDYYLSYGPCECEIIDVLSLNYL